MAMGHITYGAGSQFGADLKASLDHLEAGRNGLARHVAALIQMKDGATLTAYAVGAYGFETVGNATAALAEMESAKGALDGIAATLDQLFAKFRSA